MKHNKLINRIVEKYTAVPAPVKAAFYFTACSFAQRGISMVTTPIFTRLLPTDEYGLYSTYLSWESILLIIVSLCLYKSVMNLYNKFEDREAVLSSVFSLEILLTIIWLVLGFCFRKEISILFEITPILVVCLFISIFFQSGFQCWALYKRYIYDYKPLVRVTLLLAIGTAVLGIVMVVFDAKAESRVISAVIVNAIIGIWIFYDVYKRSRKIYWKEVWGFSLSFCIPLMPHYLSEFVLQSSDKIMINYMCGSSDVAIYSVAYSIGSLIGLVANSINSSFAPYQYQKIKSAEYSVLAKRANQVLLFLGVLLAVIMLFSKEIILLFGGVKYLQSADVVIPICLGIYFNYMFQLFARVQEFYERKTTVVLPSILCAALNIVLNLIFIRKFGFQAAAYTTFVSYFAFCIVHYIFYRRVCNELLENKQIYDVRGIVIISFGTISSGIIIYFINQINYLKYSIIVLLCVAGFVFRKKILLFCRAILSK